MTPAQWNQDGCAGKRRGARLGNDTISQKQFFAAVGRKVPVPASLFLASRSPRSKLNAERSENRLFVDSVRSQV